MRPALPYATEAARQFAVDVAEIASGELHSATIVLDGLDGAALRAHSDDAKTEWGRRNLTAVSKYAMRRPPR